MTNCAAVQLCGVQNDRSIVHPSVLKLHESPAMPCLMHCQFSNLTAKTHIRSMTGIGTSAQRKEEEENVESDQKQKDLATPNIRPALLCQ